MPNPLLPKGVEIKLKVFSASSPRMWVNIETGQKFEARAFDWTTKEPIWMGEEPRVTNKEFVYSPTSACVSYQLIFKKLGWKRLSQVISETTGVNISPEQFESDIKGLLREGQKMITIMTLAWTLARFTCKDNKIIYWKGDTFLLDDLDVEIHEESWNKRLEKSGSKWRLIK